MSYFTIFKTKQIHFGGEFFGVLFGLKPFDKMYLNLLNVFVNLNLYFSPEKRFCQNILPSSTHMFITIYKTDYVHWKHAYNI